MMTENTIGIIVDDDFASNHIPPYPKPSFISFEHPFRIRSILNHLERANLFKNNRIIKVEPKMATESILELAHSKYHIEAIKRISNVGGGFLDEEVFVSDDTYALAKKAVGGAIEAIEGVINGRFNQSFALIRPPGHHAFREKASGLCIFNNIANSILYLRKQLKFSQKIAIIDIDDHFGDGLAQFFYDDPSILYFSIHEFDFTGGDLGMIDELGIDEGIGKNINFPVPAGFDMYFADPIGNCLLTSIAYNKFAERLLKIAEEVCKGKISFILEGGYNIIGLPYCVHAVIKALLKEKYEPPEFEKKFSLSDESKREELEKIKTFLTDLLQTLWDK